LLNQKRKTSIRNAIYIGFPTLDYPFGYWVIPFREYPTLVGAAPGTWTTTLPIPYLDSAQGLAETTDLADRCTIGMAESLLFRDGKEPKK